MTGTNKTFDCAKALQAIHNLQEVFKELGIPDVHVSITIEAGAEQVKEISESLIEVDCNATLRNIGNKKFQHWLISNQTDRYNICQSL